MGFFICICSRNLGQSHSHPIPLIQSPYVEHVIEVKYVLPDRSRSTDLLELDDHLAARHVRSGEAEKLSVRVCSTAWLGMTTTPSLSCCRSASISATSDGRKRNTRAARPVLLLLLDRWTTHHRPDRSAPRSIALRLLGDWTGGRWEEEEEDDDDVDRRTEDSK